MQHKSFILDGKTGTMTPLDIAKEIFPDKPNDWLDYVLWNRTAYPLNDPTAYRLQLMEFRDAIEECPEGRNLCEMCNRLALPDQWVCEYC